MALLRTPYHPCSRTAGAHPCPHAAYKRTTPPAAWSAGSAPVWMCKTHTRWARAATKAAAL